MLYFRANANNKFNRDKEDNIQNIIDLDKYITNYNSFYNSANLFYLAIVATAILKLANLVEKALGLIAILKHLYQINLKRVL